MDDVDGPRAITVTTVPARAAYLVRAGSRSGFRRAVQEASTRWGGMTEPIIPVRKGGRVDPWWRQVVELADVEALVDVDVPADADAAAARLGLPVVRLDTIDHWGPASWTVHPVDIGDLDAVRPPTIATASDGPLWEAVAAGDVTSEHQDHLGENHIALYRPQTPDGVARAMLGGETLIERTTTAFAEHFAAGGVGAIPTLLWVTRPNDLRDCLWFWNVRALRSLMFLSPILLLPDREVEHWVDFAPMLHGMLARPAEFSPDVVIASIGVDSTKLDRLAALLQLERSTEKLRTGHRFPAELRVAPFTYLADIDPTPWVVFDRTYGLLVHTEMHVHRGRASVRVTSPVPFKRGGKTLLRVRSDAFAGLPHRPAVADAIMRNATWHRDWVQIATNAQREYPLDVKVPTLPDALRLLLERVTTSFAPSDKGLVATAMLRELDIDCLLAPGVAEAVRALTTPRAKELERALRQMHDEGDPDQRIIEVAAQWGGRGDRRHLSTGAVRERVGSSAVDAAELLCSLRWAERGVQTECDHCRMRNFVSLAEVEDPVACPGCRAPARLSQTGSSVDVHYRLNSFVDRAGDQGVVPHLLAIAALRRRDPATSLLPGTNLVFDDGAQFEVDLVGLHAGRLVSGEVKSSANEFTPEQITRDIAVSSRIGADVHVMAATTAIPGEAAALMERLATAAGLGHVVLGQTELRPAQT